MVQYCYVKGCKTAFVKGGDATFHKFPKDEVIRKMWVAKLQRGNFVVKDSTKICSKHFQEECFDRSKFGGTWLKKDAIPTIFNFPNCPMKQTFVNASVPQDQVVRVDTVPPSSNISSVQNQVRADEVPPPDGQIFVAVPFFQNQAVKVEEVSLSESDRSRPEEETIVASVFQYQGAVKEEEVSLSESDRSRLEEQTIVASVFQNQGAVKEEEVSFSESDRSSPEEQTIVASVFQNQDAVRKRLKRKYYLGDYDENDMHSPCKAKQVLALAKAREEVYKKDIRNLKKKNMLMERKIRSLKKILNELMSKRLRKDQKISKRVGVPL